MPGDNLAPVIESVPPTGAKVGALYAYDILASDPESDPISYTLTEGPAGMSLNASTGEITWTPAETGSQAVSVEASDG